MSLTGSVLGGMWHIGQMLGEGACGKVYEVTNGHQAVGYNLVAKVIPLPPAKLKGKALYRKLTPAGVAEQVEQQGKKAAASFGDFVGTFRAAMAEREAELRTELNIPATND